MKKEKIDTDRQMENFVRQVREFREAREKAAKGDAVDTAPVPDVKKKG